MSAALKLEIYQNGEFLREVPFENEELMIGRDEDCVIRLEDRAISRKHGSFKATAQGVEFEKKSKFGQVRVNGKEIEQASLKGGDRLEMGPFEIRVKQAVQAASAAPVVAAPTVVEAPSPVEFLQQTHTTSALPEVEIPTTAVEMGMEFGQPEGVEAMNFDPSPMENQNSNGEQPGPSGNTGAFDFAKVDDDGKTRVFSTEQTDMKPVLQFGNGAANVTTYELTDGEIAIGRSQKCSVVLEDKRSSRKHSLIRKDGKRFVLKDLGSANGTLVNGERVDEHELQSGDEIQIGDTKFTFQMVQGDYEAKKDQFIQVAHEEPAPEMSAEPLGHQMMAQMMPVDQGSQFQAGMFEHEMPHAAAQPAPDFAAPAEEKKSFIGKFLDRYRAMNTKQQMIYGAVILAGVYFMLNDDDAPQKRAHLNTGKAKSAQVKKSDKKPGSGGASFESLTPEQQRYIETQYQLAFDLYKNREYDSSLLEVGKIFSLVQDFKNAREIEAFAREGKRKLETQEEERKKKEIEKQAALKLQNLIEQAGMLMEKKRFAEAEMLFPEIELLQPENAAVGTWRKQMVEEKEKAERELVNQKQIAEINKSAWADFEKAKGLAKDLKYWDALDAYDELVARTNVSDKKFIPTVKAETKRVETQIAADRDPVFAQAKQFESDGKVSDAYRSYQKVLEIDPTYSQATEGMKRIRGSVTGKAKAIYAEGVFAESYSDWDTAEKKFREVMESVPTDDPYYEKSVARLKKLTPFRHPASTSGSETPQ
jgi:pSer/pThr/pTyr-binding forkhead associated (FHA) protein/tetratricopeptide (TPR) repeat protein